MEFDSSVMGFQGVAKTEQLRLGHTLPAKGYRPVCELFPLSYLSVPFKRLLCLLCVCP